MKPAITRSAVELRLREIRRRLLENLVGPAQLEVLALELLEALTLLGGQARAGPGITLRPGAPTSAASPRYSRSSRRSTSSPPTATRAPPRARSPSAPPAPVLPEKTLSVSAWPPSSQGLEPPGKPGRFTCHSNPSSVNRSPIRISIGNSESVSPALAVSGLVLPCWAFTPFRFTQSPDPPAPAAMAGS